MIRGLIGKKRLDTYQLARRLSSTRCAFATPISEEGSLHSTRKNVATTLYSAVTMHLAV